MKTLSAEDTKNHLKKAFELEAQIYSTKKVIDELNYNLEEQKKLENYNDYVSVESKRVSNNVSDYLDKDFKPDTEEYSVFTYLYAMLWVAIVLYLAYFAFCLIFSPSNLPFGMADDFVKGGVPSIARIIAGIVAAFFAYCFAKYPYKVFTRFIRKKKEIQTYEKAEKDMKDAISKHEESVRKAKLEKREKFDEKLVIVKRIENELIDAIKIQNNTLVYLEDKLEKLYSEDIIHKKYRALIPVCELYEYFDTERCYELTGPDGAYNLFETELRQNLIIQELNDVNYNLAQIQDNQQYLYNAINTVNTNVLDLSDTIKKECKKLYDGQNSAIGALCSVVGTSAEQIRRAAYVGR